MIVPLLLTLLWIPPGLSAQKLIFGIEGGYFMPSDSDLKDVYGSGGFLYGINGTLLITPNIAIEAGFNLFSIEGTITNSTENTTLGINNLRLGAFYNFGTGKLIPRVGAGMIYSMVKEENYFGQISESALGWFIGAGLDLRLGGSWLAGMEVIYHDVNMGGDFGDESLGGISLLFSFKLEI